ncbi:hypothetical protein AVEN_267369-1 [Araneus ventricosus]|uniref:Uncharacterized protein n=1 Tax=Araneus ventricosus TaxID=182803 RepID=A0A4Y2TJN0_ARAVE|nr:hypothetical protein AVEN_267369-1 [Araneus ventricosus]
MRTFYLEYCENVGLFLQEKMIDFQTNKQKEFALENFNFGETTGQKQTPEQVQHAMRTGIQEGKKRFSTEEYLSKVQIQSLFARFASKKNVFNKSDYSVTDWVAILLDKMWCPGEITDIENSDIKVKCVKRPGKNTFTLSEDHYWYKGEEIMCKISAPSPLNE